MKKVIIIVVLSIIGVYSIKEYYRNKELLEYETNKQEVLNKMEEIEDNLHGYSKKDTIYFAYANGNARIYLSNKKYVVKENIGNNRMIIYDGEGTCYLGTITLEKGKYPIFRPEIDFKHKPSVSGGYVFNDDINGLIKELKRAKIAYNKYHNISVKNQVTHFYDIDITGDSSWFTTNYCYDSGTDYVSVGTVSGSLEFNSTNEIDDMIKILNKFKAKKLINVKELYS